MNYVAARILTIPRLYWNLLSLLNVETRRLRSLWLILSLLVSAFGLIYMKDVHRRLLSDYQLVTSLREELKVDWSKLLLERTALSSPSRIQIMANNINMHMPVLNDLVVVDKS